MTRFFRRLLELLLLLSLAVIPARAAVPGGQGVDHDCMAAASRMVDAVLAAPEAGKAQDGCQCCKAECEHDYCKTACDLHHNPAPGVLAALLPIAPLPVVPPVFYFTDPKSLFTAPPVRPPRAISA